MDITAQALGPLWKADPGFVDLAKYLYGPDVTMEQVQKDLFGKMDPGPSDVHVNQPALVPAGKKKKILTVDERALSQVGKSFYELVEKAYQAGLIDNDGNLNEAEISKSTTYVRDHAGRFAHTGGHTVAHLAAAGVLAGGGALLATKTPAAAKYAAETTKFVSHNLKSADPVERHVARSLVPHLLGAHARALATAGASATSSAGAVYEGTKTYEHIRHMAQPVQKDWSDYDSKRKRNLAGGAVGGGLTGAGSQVALLAHKGGKEKASDAKFARNRQADAMIASATNEPVPSSGLDHTLFNRFGSSNWGEHADRLEDTARTLERGTKKLKGLRRGGIATAAVGAGILGASAYSQHKIKKDAHEVVWSGDISKVDSDKQQIFGWASVAELDGKPVVDLQGDYIHPDDVEKAAYDYVLNSRVGGDMHDRIDEYGNLIEKAGPRHVSDLIESMVFTPEKCEAMGISKNLAGRWWTGFQVNDPDVWMDVKEGRRTGFSIHGAGLRKSIDITELDPTSELIGKAYQESETLDELVDNLATLYDVTGEDDFATLAKHLMHGITSPQNGVGESPQPSGASRELVGAGVGGAIGAHMGTIGGAMKGGKAEKIGSAVGGLAGAGMGALAGHSSRPQRPPSVEAVLGPSQSPQLPQPFKKAVSRSNRMGGGPMARQEMYTQHALQQATEQLAPQVAQHIQNMQQQQWQQQMMEQQQMAMMANQMPQNFAVEMGPHANRQHSGSNPLTPSQHQPNQQSEAMTMPNANTQMMGSSRQGF